MSKTNNGQPLLIKDQAGSASTSIYILGQGIDIQTRTGFVPSRTLRLLPGQALTLRGPDIREYFFPTNLDIQGLDPAFLFNGGQLPSGFYTFTIQAFDDQNRPVSNVGTAPVNVFLRLPPLLIYPSIRSLNNREQLWLAPANLLLFG